VDEVVADLRNQLVASEQQRQTHQTKIVELEEALRLLQQENTNHANHYNSYFEDQEALAALENQVDELERQRRVARRQHEQTERRLHLCVYLLSGCCAVNEMRLTQMEEQIRQLQDRLRLRIQEMEDVSLDLQSRQARKYAAAIFQPVTTDFRTGYAAGP
jgi:chromosome segregation ATPase